MNNNQCTITWFVDHIKVSHVDSKIIDDVLKMIKSDFDDIKITKDTKHKFLVMNVKFFEKNR